MLFRSGYTLNLVVIAISIVDITFNGGLPISRVAPLDQLLPLSLDSSG